MTGGRVVNYSDGAFNDIVDIGEIPDHVTTVEHLYRLSVGDGRGEEHRRHVRTSPRAIDSEESKTCGRDPVKL